MLQADTCAEESLAAACLSGDIILSLLAALVEKRFCEKRIPFSFSFWTLPFLFSFSFSLAASWVPRGAPTSENAPSHGHKTYRDRDLRREEHLSEPTHTLGRHRAREWQPVQDKRFLLARETSTRSRDLASSRCIEA